MYTDIFYNVFSQIEFYNFYLFYILIFLFI